MKDLKWILILILSINTISCNVSYEEIIYDYDQCSSCKMTISDDRFGCEYVSTKGKVYKFDAIECMVRELNKSKYSEKAYILVTHFNNPGKLQNAFTSYYFISKERPSPMGSFLSSYESLDKLTEVSSSLNGRVYTWKELITHEQFN